MRESICLCVLVCVAACQPRGTPEAAPVAGRHAAASSASPLAANALQVSIVDALRTRRLQPSRFEDKQPAPGDSFLVLDVSVRNPGRDTRVFNAGPLVVVAGGKEHRFDTPENIIADGYLLLEALKPGSSLQGRIVYEVPADLDGPMYWLPGNGQRLRVQPVPTPMVSGAAHAQVAAATQAPHVPASPAPMPPASTSHASTAQAPASAPIASTPSASTPSASTSRDSTSRDATPTAATAADAGASPQLRELACRALVTDNNPAEQARYSDFFREQCKGHALPRAWEQSTRTARAEPGKGTRVARTTAHAAERVQRDVAAEAPEPAARVVPSDSGPSFDCAQATLRAEQLVCADALLSLLDRQLAQAMTAAERKVADPTALLRDQDDWRARVRNACQTLNCLERAYTQRTAGLRAIGGFAEAK